MTTATAQANPNIAYIKYLDEIHRVELTARFVLGAKLSLGGTFFTQLTQTKKIRQIQTGAGRHAWSVFHQE